MIASQIATKRGIRRDLYASTAIAIAIRRELASDPQLLHYLSNPGTGRSTMRTAYAFACLMLLSTAPTVAGQTTIALDRCPANADAVVVLISKLRMTESLNPTHPYRSVKYDPSPLRVLGVTPIELNVGYAEGRLSSLTLSLPAGGQYLASFRRHAPGNPRCRDNECWWGRAEGKHPRGLLKEAGLNENADDPLFVCGYALGL